PVPAAKLGELIVKQKELGLNNQTAGKVYARMLAEGGCGATEAIAALGITVVSDLTALTEIIRRAMAANPRAVADFKGGKKAAANALKGAVMRETRGTARADLVEQILMQELAKEEKGE